MFAQRLGLPNLRGTRSFVVATFIDFLGTGLFLPFSLLYFTRAVGLPLPAVGLALSIAMTMTLPLVPLTGMLVDRFGTKRVVLLAQFLQGAGFLGYLVVRNVPMLLGMALLNAIGQRLFWSTYFTLMAEIAAPTSEIAGTAWEQRPAMPGLASAACWQGSSWEPMPSSAIIWWSSQTHSAFSWLRACSSSEYESPPRREVTARKDQAISVYCGIDHFSHWSPPT